MHDHATVGAQAVVTWVLVADSKQARIYESHRGVRQIPLDGANIHHYYDEKSNYGMMVVAEGDFTSETIHDYQIGHDRRGTSSSSNSSTHNTYEPHGEITEELKRRFIKSIAKKLQHDFAEKKFGHVVLVAPAKMIGELREHLPTDIQKCVVAELSKELTGYHGRDLVNHLQETLTQAHAA